MEDFQDSMPQEPPIWAIFGDLMSGLVGVFVLLLVWALGFQLELAQSLEQEVKKRQAEEQRRMALEEALADPLASGRVTLQGAHRHQWECTVRSELRRITTGRPRPAAHPCRAVESVSW